MKLIDVILESKELKRTIVKRSLDYNIPLRYLCKESGIEYNTFIRSYINSTDGYMCEANEDQFKKLLGILGISIRYQFIIDKEVDMISVSNKLNDKYSLYMEKRKEFQRKPDNIINRLKSKK